MEFNTTAKETGARTAHVRLADVGPVWRRRPH